MGIRGESTEGGATSPETQWPALRRATHSRPTRWLGWVATIMGQASLVVKASLADETWGRFIVTLQGECGISQGCVTADRTIVYIDGLNLYHRLLRGDRTAVGSTL